MANNTFSPMAIDAIGEAMNISLGSSATAVSNMLDHRVDITTPSVQVINDVPKSTTSPEGNVRSPFTFSPEANCLAS